MVATLKRRWFQFRLRTLLIVFLVLSLPLSWFAVRMESTRKQREAIAAIRKAGGRVHIEGTLWSAPDWVRAVSGDGYYVDIAVGSPDADFGDEEAKYFKDLPNLRGLQLGGLQITDAGLENLRGMPHLWKLYLNDAKITDAGLKHLAGLSGLRMLVIGGMPVTDTGLAHLKGLTNLEDLMLRDTLVTGAGLQNLKGLTKLKDLDLTGPAITDAGFEHLAALPNLKRLFLHRTGITDAGLEHLGRMTRPQYAMAGRDRDHGYWP